MKLEKCKCGGMKRKGYEQCRKCYLNYYVNRTTKICAGCDRDLPLKAFRSRLNESRPRSRCKECEAEYARIRGKTLRKEIPEIIKSKKRQYYDDNKQRARMWGFESRLRRLGIITHHQTIRDYIKSHNGLCEICGQPPIVNENLSIDHCHKTGEFRGLLCNNCNHALGHLKDNPDLLLKAVDYLKKHNQVVSDKLDPAPLSNSPVL